MPGGGSPNGHTPALYEIDGEASGSSVKMEVVWLVVKHRGPKKVSRTPGPGPSYSLGAKILIELNR
jgi:hypothetical protein